MILEAGSSCSDNTANVSAQRRASSLYGTPGSVKSKLSGPPTSVPLGTRRRLFAPVNHFAPPLAVTFLHSGVGRINGVARKRMVDNGVILRIKPDRVN